MDQTNTLFRPADLQRRFGLSRTTIHRLVKSGRLKPPIRIGRRATAFIASDVQEFIARCVAEREAS